MSKNLENYVKSQEDSFIKEITDLKENVSESKKMPEDFSDFVKECERKNSLTDREFELYMDYMRLIAKYKGYRKLKVGLYNLTSLTDKQAESLSEVGDLVLYGLTSLTDKQAECLSKVSCLSLDGLTSLTDKQAEYLSKVRWLNLDNLTAISDKQAECLSKVRYLTLDGLTSITDKQAMEFAKMEHRVELEKDILTEKQKEILGM